MQIIKKLRKTMKLYEIPKDSKIILNKDQECSDGSKYIIFHHLDGMYSYCKTEKGGIIHLHCGAELKKVKDGYKLCSKE